MRINIKRQDEFYYKLAKIAKECAEYNNVYGLNMVWDFKKDCWVEPKKDNNMLFNTACQAGANIMNTNIKAIKKAVDIVLELGEDKDLKQFYMPRTKTVIEVLKRYRRKKNNNYEK